jgi:hypothetical protein
VKIIVVVAAVVVFVIIIIIIIVIIGTTTLCGSFPTLKTFPSHPVLVPLFSS